MLTDYEIIPDYFALASCYYGQDIKNMIECYQLNSYCLKS